MLILAITCLQVQALKKLKSLDPDKCSIVRWHKSFTDRGCNCLEFEYLEKSLSDFMKQRQFRPLFVKEIRPIVQQVYNASSHSLFLPFFYEVLVFFGLHSLPMHWNTWQKLA